MGERGLALTGDSSFFGPYRMGVEQIDAVLDSLAKLSSGDGDLTRATNRLDQMTRSWQTTASQHFAARANGQSPAQINAIAQRVSAIMDSAHTAATALQRVTRLSADRTASEATMQIDLASRESLLIRLLLLAMIVLATVASLRRVTSTLDAIVFDARALA